MKLRRTIYFLAYLAAAVLAIIILAMSPKASHTISPLRPVILATGIIFIIPGFFLLFSSIFTRADARGEVVKKPWYVTTMGLLAMVWGIACLIAPDQFTANLPITLGISLLIIGATQLVWITRVRKAVKSSAWVYIVPFIIIAIGIVDLLWLPHYGNTGDNNTAACLISGIGALIWAINGIISLFPKKTTVVEEVPAATAAAIEDKTPATAEAEKEKETTAKADESGTESKGDGEAAQK